jgi:type I restriction enzyme M protein
MLDQETKRRIDTARDILVGKLPNPQSQVEQITIAMIYKFMDDMDKEAMEFGGEPTFFTGDYEKYSWTKIFDPKLGGYEMLALYGEAIVKLNQNPNIPQLFRDIFKNAYLPYRDPETLKMFLKVINEFHYDHSEKLGDAFEYLLSVLGSQGDAGQFRTPRHIIDFMVAIMQPKKDESICDPACGTAGFLISSYKHILNQNTKKNKGDLLTPDERKKLINNFVGYDISSEMVRLSLVNMYLHGFTTPKIYEYDTLTYTDRWGDTFDIIMANPPFMTPKGGIRPHKKFAMQANRSEVLFVDYIMEHINPTTGRAAVIVPEGIIFQSATAYKALRKLLIENNFLYGVVSLPAGIFQPYSGVKTSILLLDKTLAKKTDKILFVKIENDGYSLGAQRKELSTSDLPDATNFIKQYITAIRNDDFSQFDFEHLPLNSIAVEKNRITENGDYNLSGERYRVNLVLRNKRFEWVCLGDIANISAGNSAPQGDEYFDNGTMPFFRTSDVGKVHISHDLAISNDYVNEKAIKELNLRIFKKGTILFPKSGASVFLNHRVMMAVDGYVSSHLATIYANEAVAVPKYLFYMLCLIDAKTLTENQNYPSLRLTDIFNIKIPLPPLSIQQEIVSKIEQYEKIIAGAKQVVENYKPQIDIKPDWEMVELVKIADVNDKSVDPVEAFGDTEFCYVDISSVENETGIISFDNIISTKDAPSRARRVIAIGDILLSTVRPNLKAFGFIDALPDKCLASTGFAVITAKSVINPRFLYYCFFNEFVLGQMYNRMGKGSYPSINQSDVNALRIPLPPVFEQKAIVSQIEKEQQMVNATKELINIYEQKIKDEINKLWEA